MEMQTIEGNILEISFPNRYFVLVDGEGKTQYKIYWKPQHEPYMAKQKAGYYEKPVVDEKNGEYFLEDIRYLPRPDGFPRLKNQQGAQQQRRQWGKSPEERRDIMRMACLKAAVEIWQCPFVDDQDIPMTYEEICARVVKAAVEMEKVMGGE